MSLERRKRAAERQIQELKARTRERRILEHKLRIDPLAKAVREVNTQTREAYWESKRNDELQSSDGGSATVGGAGSNQVS